MLPVQGYNGDYLVSEAGEIFSVSRYVNHPRHGSQFVEGRKLKPGRDGNGYLFVYLRKDGKSNMHKVHRLVALAFVPNPENLPQVNHEDGNKENCAASNLKWVTGSDNIKHSFAMGLNVAKRGKDNVSSKKVMQIDKTGKLIATFGSVKEAERMTGIKSQSICSCAGGVKHYNTAGGYKWEY